MSEPHSRKVEKLLKKKILGIFVLRYSGSNMKKTGVYLSLSKILDLIINQYCNFGEGEKIRMFKVLMWPMVT